MEKESAQPGVGSAVPRLSICIATFERGKFIAETLDSILAQWQPGVEVIVVDGASPDDTPEVIKPYLTRSPGVRYYREPENSGVDRDYDKAVGYARGDYCWLMPDDDLLRPGAIAAVLGLLDQEYDLLVANAEVRNADFSRQLAPKLLKFPENRVYDERDSEKFFSEVATCLSFIGCVVVRRDWWLGRDRASYYGSLFVHVGVIFQHPPVGRAAVIAAPLITIRYGNAMWAPRWFEIWMFKWPQLVWSFKDFSDRAKAAVCPREPWRDIKTLLFYRATGGYTANEYQRLLAGKAGAIGRIIPLGIAMIPGILANALASLYFFALKRESRMSVNNLSRSPHANAVTQWVARVLGV
jgi:abequosyltransferase